MNPYRHVGTVMYTTVLAVVGHSLLPARLLLIGHSGRLVWLLRNVGGPSLLPVGLLLIGCSSHWCSCSTMLGCAHATVSVGAATKRQVAKDTALHVQYLLKSILCNSHEQIQQPTTLTSSSTFPFILGSLPVVSSQLSNHQGGHQGHWTLVDQ